VAVHDLCGRVLGGFVIDEFLDEGGYGKVYRARQTSPEREVVVKILRHKAPDSARFRREAQSLARVSHPNAVRVIASGIEDDGLMWIAMELVQGTDLATWLAEHGPMPLAAVVPLIEQIADAVHTAHKLGIVHRDLKPNNIMVTLHAGKLTPTLLDFGIAKWLDDVDCEAAFGEVDEAVEPTLDDERPVTSRGVVSTSKPTRPRRYGPSTPATPVAPPFYSIGTYEYKSPEMWNDPRTASPAADVYALGIIAYELLAGRRPFDGKTRDEWQEQHRLRPLAPIRGSTPGVFEALHRALAKRPEDRPSARVFAASLRDALASDPAEQIKASARLWEAHGRSPDLLWGPSAIAAAEQRQRIAHDDVVTRAFHAASRRRVQVVRWKLIAAVLAVALAGGAYRWRKNAEVAEERAEAATTQAEVEQGRQALLLGDSARATEHLADAYQRGDRSWSTEFMYARALEPQGAELARFQALSGRMWSVTYSPDERQIATTDEGGAQVFDAHTFKRLYALPHTDVVYDAAYTADGAQLITACGDGAVRIWDAASGELVRELRKDARFAKLAVRGHVIAAIDFEGRSLYIWDATSGSIVAESHGETPSAFLSLAFSSDGRWLAANIGAEARVFDTGTWEQAVAIRGAIRSLAWAPTGTSIATGSSSGDVSLWDLSGHRTRQVREAGSAVDLVVFSPDGKLLATADRDGTARVWDAATGELRSQSTRAGRVRSMRFAGTSTLLAVAAADGSVNVFEARSGLPLAALHGAQDAVWSMQFDATASHVLAASWDGSARLWLARSLYRQWTSLPVADHCDVYNTAVPDQRFVIIGCEKHATRVWDAAHDRLLAELPPMPSKMEGDFASVLPVVSHDGSRAAVARGNFADIYELPGGRPLRTVVHSAQVTALAFGRAGELASGAADGTLRLTPDRQGAIVLPAASAGIDSVAVLADGRVVSADAGKQLRVISPDGTSTLQAPTRTTLLRPSQDGSKLVTIQDNTIPSLSGRGDPAVLWDLRSMRMVSALSGHKGRVFNARWAADRILTTASDGSVRLWDGMTGRQVRAYKAQARRFLADAAISSDGALLAAGGADGLVEFWDVATGRELWALRAHASHVVGLHFDGADLVTRGFGGEMARWHFTSASDVVRRMVIR
jgi:eukaryotic-like serine/threonine-protein kinase